MISYHLSSRGSALPRTPGATHVSRSVLPRRPCAGTSFGATPQRRIRVASGLPDDDAPVVSLSAEQAASFLGLSLEASYDDIVSAKDAKLKEEGVDSAMVDAAYDALLMNSMKKRLSGDVASSVRFADVPKYRPPEPKQNFLQNLPGGLAVEQVPGDKSLTVAGVFGVCAAWALLQGITDSPSAAQADVAGLQLGIALSASVYFLTDYKRLGIGRSVGITGAGLILGALVGQLLQAWLRVDIVPIGSFGAPGVLVSEAAILGVWATCTFLA